MVVAETAVDCVDSTKRLAGFLIKCHQWDGIELSDVDAWIENFTDDEGKVFACRILDNLLYYSERDIEHLLKTGLVQLLVEKTILAGHQLQAGFCLTQPQLTSKFSEEIESTLFVPLSDRNAPYESGNQMARILVHRLGVATKCVRSVGQVNHKGTFRRVVIVDDCLGSGNQLRKFWSSAVVRSGVTLREWCRQNGIAPYYLTLVGCQENVEAVSQELGDLPIVCVEVLGPEHHVFGEQSLFWKSQQELIRARVYFEQLAIGLGTRALGYKDLDLAVIMHLTVPNWSLPVLWDPAGGHWAVLMRRKGTYALK